MYTKKPHNKIVYEGKLFKVGVKRLTASGHTAYYSTILAGKSAVVVPILGDGRVLLEYNYRPTVNKWVYELPAGHVEKGELPKHCAVRELEEETGYRARSMKFLFRALASPGISDEEMYVFLATYLIKGRHNREPLERIRLRPMGLETVLEKVRKREEVDMKTIAGITFYKELLAKKGKL